MYSTVHIVDIVLDLVKAATEFTVRRRFVFREGRLRVGDRIISINGMDVRRATHNEAVNLLKQDDDNSIVGVRLGVEYDVALFGTYTFCDTGQVCTNGRRV